MNAKLSLLCMFSAMFALSACDDEGDDIDDLDAVIKDAIPDKPDISDEDTLDEDVIPQDEDVILDEDVIPQDEDVVACNPGCCGEAGCCEETCPCDPECCGKEGCCEETCPFKPEPCDASCCGKEGCCFEACPSEPEEVTCERQIAPVSEGICKVTKGSGQNIIIEGTVLADDKVYTNGRVMFKNETDAKIACVGCDCADETATVISCPEGVISPALINPHDHSAYAEIPPNASGSFVDGDGRNQSYNTNANGERYEHRHDWRRGRFEHTELPVPSTKNTHSKAWAELRMMIGGAMSIAGSAEYKGLLRNLDTGDGFEKSLYAVAPTFVFGDTGGFQSEKCNYNETPDETKVVKYGAYVPHVSEGILNTARNEFLCLTGRKEGGKDVLGENSAIIHGVGLNAEDIYYMGKKGIGLIWSPRSNISLYGNTAIMPLYKKFGVTVALGTDWSASGSINMLREFACAKELNERLFDSMLSDYELWKMATINAAELFNAGDQIGHLKNGYVADIAIFNREDRHAYQAVTEADVQDVMLMMRGGKALLGEPQVMSALLDAADLNKCESLDVCGSARTLCLELDIEMNLSQLRSKLSLGSDAYDLFYCGKPNAPVGEPSCVPVRNGEYGESAADDRDYDGIPDSEDNCPDLFNPPRQNRNGDWRTSIDVNASGAVVQPDNDGDAVGDVCDFCVFNKEGQCVYPVVNDRDHDGIDDDNDNCPYEANPNQEDADNDGTGDACEFTLYDINRRASEMQGRIFEVENLVVTAQIFSGDKITGVFAQLDPDSDGYTDEQYAGLYVYFTKGNEEIPRPAVGQKFSVKGTYKDYNKEHELQYVTEVKIVEGSNVTIEPRVIDAATIAKAPDAVPYESILVTVKDVEVTNIEPAKGYDNHNTTGEFEVTGGLRVDNALYKLNPFPAVGDKMDLTGVARYTNSLYNIEPRSESDVVRK